MDTGIKGYRETGKQRHRETEIQGHTLKDTLIQEYKDTEKKDTGIQGYRDTRM